MIVTRTKSPKHQLIPPRTSCSSNTNKSSSQQYHDWYVPAALSTYSSVSVASSSTKNTAPDGRSTRAAVSAMMTTWSCLKTVLETVYRCDSAAVVAVRETASSCGSVAHQALYQGVEVIYTTTTSSSPCHTTKTHPTNNSSSSSRIGDNSNATTNSAMETPTTETPFMVYQCFCDDDDFIAHTTPSILLNDNDDEEDDDDSRNPTPSFLNEGCDDDDNRRSRCADDEIEKETAGVRQDDPPALVAARWKTHTKDFYAKIYAPTTQRVRTRLLHDLDLPSSSSSPTKSTTTIATKAATAQHSAFAFFRFLENNNSNNNKTTAADEGTVITDRPESCPYLMA